MSPQMTLMIPRARTLILSAGLALLAASATPLFGQAVSGYHLIDGRASYGFGLQFFFLGYPLHFDWSKLTDLKVASPTRFDFWVGFDF